MMMGVTGECAMSLPTPHLSLPISLNSSAVRRVRGSRPIVQDWTTLASGNTCTHRPAASSRATSNRSGWSTPPPLRIGSACPHPMKVWIRCLPLGKQISWVQRPQRMRMGSMATSHGVSAPISPGSSQQDSWLATVMRGMPAGLLLILASQASCLESSTTWREFNRLMRNSETSLPRDMVMFLATRSSTGSWCKLICRLLVGSYPNPSLE
mmetsp:Transcript_34078/g.106692  ORF Transcript_34078/g.106692 Transcript_34078/m.106692 type:complete len:210 (+) Transcript_34078:395-1024(+)